MTRSRVSSAPNPTTAVSAPGKVLLAGGYLVLDRAYTGLVFGLSARITVIAQEIKTSPGIQLSEIVVESPQFLEAQWRYGYHLANADGGIKVTQLQIFVAKPLGASVLGFIQASIKPLLVLTYLASLSGSHINPNPFVETALSYTLTYITRTGHHRPSHSIKPARLTILADNDYYSAPPSTSTSSAAAEAPSGSSSSSSTTPQPSAPRFASFPVPLSKAHKTGLGSSAALVTALTAALLTHYLPVPPADEPRRRAALHNLAQAAHCAAQGKIGSGFDVAAAVWGSCLYRRFSPDVLVGLGEVGEPGFAARLVATVDGERASAADSEALSAAESVGREKPASSGTWDAEINADGARLPPGVAVRMCDVNCGSQTVGMVKSVLAWRARDSAAADKLWASLQQRNEELAAIVAAGASRTGEISGALRAVRELVREMGRASGVPIEPESQTELLDALEAQVEGVYGGVVPGAGGFDALALLVRDDEETAKRVREFLRRWSEVKGARVSLLAVKGEMEGVRVENVGDFQEWVS